jgi:hypothetical protein
MLRNKSFAARLAALEALEAEAEQEERPIDETDADALDQDEVIAEALHGLGIGGGRTNSLTVAGSMLRTTMNGSPAARYWQRIAERAQGVLLFPLSPSEIRVALDQLETGALTVRPLSPNCWKSHHWTVHCAYSAPRETHDATSRLCHALDMLAEQTGQPIAEDRATLASVLHQVLEGVDDEPLI